MKEMYFCVDFCHSQWTTSTMVMYTDGGIQALIFFLNGECRENAIIKVGCLFAFLEGERQILSLTDRKKSSQSVKRLEISQFTLS